MIRKIEPTIGQLRMLASVRGQQWLIREDRLQAFGLEALHAEHAVSMSFDLEDFYDMREPVSITPDGVAIIEIKGALLNSGPGIYEKLGLMTRYSTIIDEVEQAQDAGARAVFFRVDSPGGTVAGNIEAARAIAGIDVPTMAYASGLACSAAYKLAVGADSIVASPSAEVGNIGTILSWADCTEFWKDVGVEWKALVSDGADLKSTFHLEPDATQLAFLQESIDEAGAEFRAWVESNRNVDQEVFRAGWYFGERAESLGLTDGTASEREALASLTFAIGAGM